jgi:epimerase transport system membrane fusion protein
VNSDNSNISINPLIETSFVGAKRFGLIIAFLVFGIFGVWAMVAPLDGAAHAAGTVTVRSYKKTIQHLEGGIVSEILVQNGSLVSAGDPIMIMNSTQSLAQLGIINGQLVAQTALEARLIAERDSIDAVSYPAALLNGGGNEAVEMAAQNQVFQARKSARDGNTEVLEQRIEQLKSRIIGLQAMKEAKQELSESFGDELADVRSLLEDGFSDKNRLRELERAYASLRGEVAELAASIASTEMQIGETRMQILQYDRQFRSEVVTELSETQSRLKDVRERYTALQDVVTRTVVRAPESGIINGLQIHTIGAVLNPGMRIADIIPQGDELIIEAKVSLIDIDRVFEGQEATIRFSSFSGQTPNIFGKVLSVSADALLDEQTGAFYYLARITVNPESLVDLGDLVLIPGMPAEVFIASGSRTLMQYLLKPLTNTVARSFIED